MKKLNVFIMALLAFALAPLARWFERTWTFGVIGKASDFKIYNDQFFGGLIEQTVQDTRALGSLGIRIENRSVRGDYDYRSLIKKISGLISRRDTTSVAAATDLAVTMDEEIMVKLNRGIGPVAQTLDAWRKAAIPFGGPDDNGAEAFSRYLGAMIGKDVAIEMLDTGLIAARQAISNGGAASTVTIAANGTMTTASMISALALFGDAANRIRMWVMHSKPFFDLFAYQANQANNGTDVANGVLIAGGPLTLNRPVFVTDSASLVVTGAPNLYHTLGLVDGAIQMVNSETQEMAFQLVSGLANLVHRLQGEYAYNLGIQGFKWDVANGGSNPAAAAVSTATNWDQWATNLKDTAGVRIISG